MGQPGQRSKPPGLPCGHPNIRSHPERKPDGRAPPKEACQVSETIKRQGKTSWFRGGRGVEGEWREGGGGRKRDLLPSWAARVMRCGPGL